MIISVARSRVIVLLIIVIIILIFTAPQNNGIRGPNASFKWSRDF